MYGEGTEVRGLAPISTPQGGLYVEVQTACDRLAKLIVVHEGVLRRVRGLLPEQATAPKQAREPQGILDFTQILHQQLTMLETQTEALGNALG